MAHFVGSWKLDASDNFDNYLKEVGVGWAMRQMASSAKPTLHVTVAGNHFVFKQESPISTIVTEFDLDVEFDEKLADGRQCKSVVRLVGDKLFQDQRGKFNSTFERYIEGDHLVITCECNGVKAVRKYKRV